MTASYPLLRSLDPHQSRIGYLGALTLVASRALDSPEGIVARFSSVLFEKIYRDDPRFDVLMARVTSDLRRKRLEKRRPVKEDPSQILGSPDGAGEWIYMSEFWIHDECMPCSLGLVSRAKVDRIVDLAHWTDVLRPTHDLSDLGFVLQDLLGEVSRGVPPPFNPLNPRPRPAVPLVYLQLVLQKDMLFPYLVLELVDRKDGGLPLMTRSVAEKEDPLASSLAPVQSPRSSEARAEEAGLLVAAVARMLRSIGEPKDPEDMLAIRELKLFRASIEKKVSTEENYLRPRMEILVDLGLLGRKSEEKPAAFMWEVTDTTRALAAQWRELEAPDNRIPDYLERRFAGSLAKVLGTITFRQVENDVERLYWFARALRRIGREFGFTPGRTAAKMASLLAWEAGTILEVGEVFDAVYSAAKSEWARFLHFSGGSRFDREFLIRVDDDLLLELERRISPAARNAKAGAT